MRIDVHTHIAALSPGKGFISPKMRQGWLWRLLDQKYHLSEDASLAEAKMAQQYEETLLGAQSHLDAAVLFAFDAVYAEDGTRSLLTPYTVENDYVARLCLGPDGQKKPHMFFGASIHPYRKDAVEELERVLAMGAVLVKWLPPTQGMDPSSPLCFPLYEAMAHYKIPLLSHTGSEHTLPVLPKGKGLEDPSLLEPALKMGVKVICAHAGSSTWPTDHDYLPSFKRLAQTYEHCYGDTAAMALPYRMKPLYELLHDPLLGPKMLHGSDYPVLPLPWPKHMTLRECRAVLREKNWIKRDVLIKETLGAPDEYWHRAETVLRLP